MLEKKIPNTPVSFLWHVTKSHSKSALFAIFVVVCASISGAVSVLFVREVIEHAEAGAMNQALIIGLLYPVYVFTVQGMWRISSVFGRHWVSRARSDAYNLLITYSFGHSHAYFSNYFAGSLLSKVGNVVRSTERLIIDFLWTHTEAAVNLIASSFVIMIVDVHTALIFQLLVVSIVFLNYKLVPQKQILSKENAESDTFLRGQIVDVFSNMSATRQYARNFFERERIGQTVNDNKNIFERSWKYSEWMRILNSIVLLLFSLLMFYLLSLRWAGGEVSTGEFVAVMLVIFRVSHDLTIIGRVFNDTATAYGEMQEGLKVLLEPHEIVDNKTATTLQKEGGHIHWAGVTFLYGENKVFNEFDLTIPAGQRVGLVGPSGAGKTTFVSLLLRQHELSSGAILIDGQNIAEVTQDSLRENIAVVPQEPLLFHRTIRENIAYGKPDATDNEVMAVARLAKAHEFIKDLAQGYDTLVGERGIKLSGGQKQRVAIARAMLKDAPILVLDEATSALDSESEVVIQQALHKLMEGKTVIAIAHRLSTLREMDRIIVLEGGKIVEDGSHDSLLKYGGVYARLWEHQAGGFLQE